MNTPNLRLAISSLTLLIAGAATATAQCSWSALSVDGPNDRVQSMVMWDPDGPGTGGPVVAIAGWFTTVGGSSMLRLATWDGTSFHSISSGTNNWCSSLAARPNGDLLIGGNFTSAGGSGARRRIALYNGVTGWSSTPANPAVPNGVVYSLASRDETSFVIGGVFTNVANATGSFESPSLSRIANWDGSGWSGFGDPVAIGGSNRSGMDPNTTLGVSFLANGDLIAVGNWHRTFDTVPLIEHIDPDTGETYYDFGAPLGDGVILNGIGRWNGTSWSGLGSGFNPDLTYPDLPPGTYSAAGRCVLELPNGDLIVGGSFTEAGGVAASFVARWEMATSTWHAMGSGLSGGTPLIDGFASITSPGVYALAWMPNGDIVAGGNFTLASGQPANNVALWNGSSWQPLGSGTNAMIRSLLVMPNGNLLVGGDFLNAGGSTATRLAVWGCTTPSCPADFNGDHARDVADLFGFINAWLAKTSNADFNHDTHVDVADLFGFINAWLAGC